MPGSRLRLRGALVAATLVAAGLACSDALGPDRPVFVRASSASSQDILPVILTVPSETNASTSADMPPMPERRAVRIRATGYISAYQVDDKKDHQVGPNGWNGCRNLAISVVYGTTQHLPIACGGSGADPVQTRETEIVVVQGTGKVHRGTSMGGTCGFWGNQYPCWRYTMGQSQTITVRVVESGITLDASPEVLAAPGNVQFKWKTDSAMPSNTPMETLEWRFSPSGGGADSVYPGSHPEWFLIRQSGTMTVSARVNGYIKTAQKYVHVGEATLDLEADKTEVWAGDTVDFTAIVRPDTTPASGFEWAWQGQGGTTMSVRAGNLASLGNAPTRASVTASQAMTSCQGLRGCTKAVVEADGAMHVDAYVGGVLKSKAKQVTVKHDGILVTVDRSNVETGESVIFTVTSKSGRPVKVTEWKWNGGADAVTVTPNCGAAPTCTVQVFESGTMIVKGTIEGNAYTYADDAAVTAEPCDPTNDPVLDSPAVRRGLKNMYEDGNPGAPRDQRKEQFRYIYRRADGTYYSLPPATYTQGPTRCKAYGPAQPPLAPGDEIVAAAHSHPFSFGDMIDCNGYEQAYIEPQHDQDRTFVGQPTSGGSINDAYGIPHYTVDGDAVHAMVFDPSADLFPRHPDEMFPPKNGAKGAGKPTGSFPWRKQSCEW